MNTIYKELAWVYDKLYEWKDYAAEASLLTDKLSAIPGAKRRSLLDVGCGTGKHMELLAKSFDVHGLDLSPEMLEAARKKVPQATFHQAGMEDFSIQERFDAITCLFSSIGYVGTQKMLNQAIACMAHHLTPAGILFVEPWFTPDQWKGDTVHSLFIDEPELKIARINTSLTEGGLSIMEMHHVVGTPKGTEHFLERHELGLFTIVQMTSAFTDAGLSVEFDPQGLTGRGAYIARRN